jgi:hypothetical protein
MAEGDGTELDGGTAESASLSITIGAAENAAKKYDYLNRDLMLHIDYEFDAPTAMNFVIIDPVLYHTSSFVEVIDVATATEDEPFETVEGFADQAFDKVLTPESNKVVDEDIATKTLAPSNYSYKGLGVFTFPVRIGNKLRVTLMMRDPVPAFYERLHVLTQETITETSKSTSKKKGL